MHRWRSGASFCTPARRGWSSATSTGRRVSSAAPVRARRSSPCTGRAGWHCHVFTAPDDRILFTTFTRNLAANIRHNLQNLCGAGARPHRGDPPPRARRAAAGAPGSRCMSSMTTRPPRFWRNVVEQTGPSDFGEAFSASRSGPASCRRRASADRGGLLAGVAPGPAHAAQPQPARCVLWRNLRAAIAWRSNAQHWLEWPDVIRHARQLLEAAAGPRTLSRRHRG
jgi:hypothetical protein